jgi:hypothetical protein
LETVKPSLILLLTIIIIIIIITTTITSGFPRQLGKSSLFWPAYAKV